MFSRDHLAASLLALAALVSCAPEAEPLVLDWDSPGNLLENASFEEGREPWFNLARRDGNEVWADFELSDEHARTGETSVSMRVRSKGYEASARVYGAVQSLGDVPFPSHIAGWYRIEEWKRGTQFQTVQVVVSIVGPQGFGYDPEVPIQLAYVLDGAEEPPYVMHNRKFLLRGKTRVPRKRWKRFQLDFAADFQEAWGEPPKGWERIDVFFEGRFDNRTWKDRDVVADVYFDDLYVGTPE